MTNDIFFAFVATSNTEGLYLGYGQMNPQGTYVLIPVSAKDEELVAQLWLGEGVPTFIDIAKDFDINRHLFHPPYVPDKKDWDELGRFMLVNRVIWDPQQTLDLLDRVGVDWVLSSMDRAEQLVREETSRGAVDSQQAYTRLEGIHTIRRSFDEVILAKKASTNRLNMAAALKEKLKKMKGG